MDNDEYPPEEAAQRRDKVLGKLLSTPPKPHAPKGESPASKRAPAKKPKQ